MLKHKFSGKRRAYIVTMRTLMTLAALLTAALVLFMIGYVLYKGLPNVTWKLLSTKPSYLTNSIGILPDILNTLYIVLASLVYVLPLGVGAAIYLTEYASNKKLVAAIEYAAETLSGIPSIIYGLVGMLVLVPGIRSFIRLSVLRKVDLPQPDGPMSAVMLFSGMSMLTSCSA